MRAQVMGRLPLTRCQIAGTWDDSMECQVHLVRCRNDIVPYGSVEDVLHMHAPRGGYTSKQLTQLAPDQCFVLKKRHKAQLATSSLSAEI
jgi:hypothetical protein